MNTEGVSMSPLVAAIPFDELTEDILLCEDEELREELVREHARRYYALLYQLHLERQERETNCWFARLGAQS